MGITVGAV